MAPSTPSPTSLRRLAVALALGALLAPLHADPISRPRRGASFHSPYLRGMLSDGTRRFLVENRLIDWRYTEPVLRVKENIHALLHHPDWKVRRAAADDLTWSPNRRVEEAWIRALRDRNLAVRERAVVALGEYGTNLSILPLIDAMDDTPGPLRDDINYSLFRLTGEWYGRHRDRWMRWYEANRALLR